MINSDVLTSVYWYSAIIGTIIFVLKTSLPIDGGSEVSADFTSVTETDASFNLFTIEGISAFFMTGGWMGWAAFSKLHYELQLSLVIAVVSGILGMYIFSWFITQFKKLEHVPQADINELVDKTGKAYMQFAPRGTGKIQIEYNSKLQILDAINDSDEEIKTFEIIKVVRINDEKVYIKKGN